VISLATSDEAYPRSLRRLERSLRRVRFRGDVLLWPPGSYPHGCPPHLVVPFAFKPFCFAEARERGHRLLLWLDSSCLAVRPLDGLFEQLEREGYLLFRNADYRVGSWAADEALRALDLDRDEAMELPEVNAAAIGLNLDHPVAAEFLERWLDAARAGTAFRGVEGDDAFTLDRYLELKWNTNGSVSSDPRVLGHRHDQTVAGVLAHRLGMALSPGGLQGFRATRKVVRPDTVILKGRASARTDLPRARIGLLRARLRAGSA
jgi:hypothetical protein